MPAALSAATSPNECTALQFLGFRAVLLGKAWEAIREVGANELRVPRLKLPLMFLKQCRCPS